MKKKTGFMRGSGICVILVLAAVLAFSAAVYAMDNEIPTRGLDFSVLGDLFGSSSGLDDAAEKNEETQVGSVVENILNLLGLSNIPIKEATIEKIPDQTYTGKQLRPTLKLTYNGNTLKRGTDYSVSYSNNIEVGTGKCKITGKGNYTGTKTVSFKIVKASAKKETEKTNSKKKETEKKDSRKKETEKTSAKTKTFKVTLSKTSYVYNGEARKPSVTVTIRGKKITASNYTVSYTNNKNVGTATVKVTGKGDYKGYSGTASFKITMKKAVLTSVKSTKEGELTASWEKDNQADGYQLEYCTNKAFSSNVKKKSIPSKTTVKLDLTKLTSGKNYYVRIRAYKKINNRNQYGDWSTIKNAKVK